jgi:hypothetical protein
MTMSGAYPETVEDGGSNILAIPGELHILATVFRLSSDAGKHADNRLRSGS